MPSRTLRVFIITIASKRPSTLPLSGRLRFDHVPERPARSRDGVRLPWGGLFADETLTGCHFVQYRAQRENVRGRVRCSTPQLFRRHVGRHRPAANIGFRRAHGSQQLG